MKRLFQTLLIVAVSLILIGLVHSWPLHAAPARAMSQSRTTLQVEGLDVLLSGKAYPLTLSLKEMDETWRHMYVNDRSVHTKGLTVGSGGETYLVAYEWRAGFEEYRRPDFVDAPRTPETKLSLLLVNVRTTTSLSNIHQFDLKYEIEEANFRVGPYSEYGGGYNSK